MCSKLNMCSEIDHMVRGLDWLDFISQHFLFQIFWYFPFLNTLQNTWLNFEPLEQHMGFLITSHSLTTCFFTSLNIPTRRNVIIYTQNSESSQYVIIYTQNSDYIHSKLRVLAVRNYIHSKIRVSGFHEFHVLLGQNWWFMG